MNFYNVYNFWHKDKKETKIIIFTLLLTDNSELILWRLIDN